LRLNQNTKHRRRHRTRQQQIEDSVEVIYSADSECEVHTRVPLRQREVRVQRETRLLPTPKRETRVLPASKHDSRISDPKCETRILRQTQPMPDAPVSTSKIETRVLPVLERNSRVFNSKREDRI